jgi:hypothetical protein
MTCGECRFYGRDEPEDSTGRKPCRRFPAAEMKLPSQWCGEFDPAEAKKPAAKKNADTVAKVAPAASSVRPADQGAR